ncbi:hypothetical protein IQ276_024760 [Desmonostoc muscorum LEGE 12446]|uniref:Uncharacterized protein n=1 Tax=Desmonostoc muscorum LEGE 12446 TaxID=1828758 RepID=A0A8J6ZXN8_DESMC|nr:hypothetical protein [Desmonostoc muscorum]MCF2149584.1 hypothetical protein [Desmonostoc muscorum LEGE 12446]
MAKNKNLSLMIAALTLFALNSSPIIALEKRPSQEIPIDELVKETMQFAEVSNNQMNLAWYLPLEAFGAPPQPVLVIAVVKADISSPDSFKFASEAEAQKGLKVTYTDSSGKSIVLAKAPKSGDVDLFITEMKPIFSKIAGKFGEGMWFFTYKNVDDSGKSIVSPYEPGKLKVSFSGKSSTPQPESTVELPLNSLFVPRLCPNGKPAHVSWKYCPWDGTPLTLK